MQRRGATALEELLKDGVDVFERKVQILDRKGFFASLPGRRRALDRLLPTIRAARDGITRELYLSRAAEAAGSGKSVRTGSGEPKTEAGGKREEKACPLPSSPPSSRPSVMRREGALDPCSKASRGGAGLGTGCRRFEFVPTELL